MKLFLSFKESIKSNNDVSDKLLLKFLRINNYSLENAVQHFHRYQDARKRQAELFEVSEKLKKVYESGSVTVTQTRTSKGELVLLTRPGLWDPLQYSYHTFINAICVIVQWETEDEGVQRNGIVNLIDCTGFGFKHITHFGPLQAKLLGDLITKILPVKCNAIHMVNVSKFAKIAYNLTNPFLDTRLRENIHFHGNNYDELQQFIDLQVIPHEFGGQCEYSGGSALCEKLLKNSLD
ncbi:alpha-tocopherol transfer protein-like protein [Leptotrombidium deliense]|uniref:Alpha-tocopherol transfer protein-like protein n=1 Tax=Leptotrombidium deliense TaxID=299467 RepID=A0A443S2L8_9ACAR|nr:alpha-tocopherol transfer protein-like protein [Leptotrombidium deliense]